MSRLVLPVSPLLLVALAVTSPGCGSDGSKGAAGICAAYCQKAADCGMLSYDACLGFCDLDSGGSSSSCEPTRSQIDGCFDALDTAACSELTDGIPECMFCEGGSGQDASGGDTTGGADAGGGGDTGGGGDGGGGEACPNLVGSCTPVVEGEDNASCQEWAGYTGPVAAAFSTECTADGHTWSENGCLTQSSIYTFGCRIAIAGTCQTSWVEYTDSGDQAAAATACASAGGTALTP